ncbi:Rv3235 family protein [Streptomyces sp. NPDC087512]|uniref:Rv3235 family protein n=1 Tax=Streptomyces sp. NPDC087512 TaxID=3155059 RepID=UPI003441B914
MQHSPTVPPLRKVMTRTRRIPHAPAPGTTVPPAAGPGTTAPAAGPRVPAGAPPRRPGGSGARPAAPGGRPPGSPGRSPRARTRPADTRPATAAPGGRSRTGTRSPAPDRTAAAARSIATPAVPPRTTATALPPAATGPSPAGARATPVVPARAPRRTVPQLSPTDHFAELLLDVLSGRRPVHSMLRHTAGRAYDELARLAERGPLRTRGTLPVVRDIGYFEPRPGALEVFARIGAGDQLRAMAFRLERGGDLRWRCTAVELGGRRAPRADDD